MREYTNPLGNAADANTDTTAFACSGGSTSVAPTASAEPWEITTAELLSHPFGGSASCTDTGTAICLNSSRFAVEVDWRDSTSRTGDGRVVPLRSGDLRLFPVHGDAEPIVLRGEVGDITTVAFSPDGQRLAAGTDRGTARVWRLDGTEDSIELSGHAGRVTGIAFSPDGKQVVTGSRDGTVRVWRVTWDELLEYVRGNLHACLTVDQRVGLLRESEREAERRWGACQEGLG